MLFRSLLEQSLLLSLMDSEARPENYLLLPDGNIGFSAVPALVTIPVEWHNEMVQYTAAAAAGNSQRAIQMLSRICAAESRAPTPDNGGPRLPKKRSPVSGTAWHRMQLLSRLTRTALPRAASGGVSVKGTGMLWSRMR